MIFTLTETITEERTYTVNAPAYSTAETIREIAYENKDYEVLSAEVESVKIVDADGNDVE